MRGLLVLGLVAGLQTHNERVVPVHEEPRHRLIFETPGTRVLDVQIAPGDTTLFHTHSDPILYVTMSTSRTRSQNYGADWSSPAVATVGREDAPSAPSVPPGRLMSTTSYAERPQTHRVNNIGNSLFRLIGITNSSAGDAGDEPSAGFDGKPEISNRWFRGYRYVLTAGQSEEHRHQKSVAIVLASGAMSLEGDASALRTEPVDQTGFVALVEGGVGHIMRGRASTSNVIEVEIR